MTCSIPGCERMVRARGWCTKHWHRWSRHGDPTVVLPRSHPPTPAYLRVLNRSEETAGCWVYTGSTLKRGYAQTEMGTRPARKSVLVHRAVYEALVGPIPAGLEIDHLCENTVCVNPAHLEPVTGAENMRRRYERSGGRQRRADRVA